MGEIPVAEKFLVRPGQLLLDLGGIGVRQGELAGHSHDCFLVPTLLVPVFIQIAEEPFADGQGEAVVDAEVEILDVVGNRALWWKNALISTKLRCGEAARPFHSW
jgi:hypothetical protein